MNFCQFHHSNHQEISFKRKDIAFQWSVYLWFNRFSSERCCSQAAQSTGHEAGRGWYQSITGRKLWYWWWEIRRWYLTCFWAAGGNCTHTEAGDVVSRVPLRNHTLSLTRIRWLIKVRKCSISSANGGGVWPNVTPPSVIPLVGPESRSHESRRWDS